jgi:mediator of RNA polymerase II transcription subunit 7
MDDDDDDAELRNPFPSPPSHYTKYSSHNLSLLALLHQRTSNPSDVNQHDVLADQSDVPDWPLTQLEKPRIDWILDDPEPYYDVFGDRWFVRNFLQHISLF